MFESRCGVRCDLCERKEQVHCTGCPSMAMPFWGGECVVKSCCEGRGLDHCGLCAEFPCTACAEHGKAQGFDPAPRLAQCRNWAKSGRS